MSRIDDNPVCHPVFNRRGVWLSTAFMATLLSIFLTTGSQAAESSNIDASDPTRIYTFAGLGLKYTDYTNGESMTELRAVGNMGLGESDMLLFEFGYGNHSGNKVEGSNDTLTNGRFRWFHMFNMDYEIEKGYRGWATQIDLQLAGKLKGTDGQNLLAMGVLPAFSLGGNWDLYLPVQVVGAWDKRFERFNGVGLGISPLLSVKVDWWEGGFVQFWPSYTRFVSGELDGEGSGNLDLHIGGNLSPTMIVTFSLQKNLDKDLRSFRRGRDTGLKNDWNAFLNLTTYF